MDDYQIIEYSLQYREKLTVYLRKKFPHYSAEYVDYCVNLSFVEEEKGVPSLLVINQHHEIVGCHLYYNTKAKILGCISNVRWGHDTYLDDNYRHKTRFPRVVSEIDAFGIGLSAINKKIQQHYHILFYDCLYNYVIFNRNIVLDIIKKVINKQDAEFVAKETLVVNNQIFELAHRVEDLHIPNGGFWCKNMVDVDFVRDQEFLNYRFFNNKVHCYYLYHLLTGKSLDECYFVVRPIFFKGLRALYLVDFRYDLSCPEQLKSLLRATSLLARQNGIGMVLFTSCDSTINKYYNSLCWKKSPLDMYAKGKLKALKEARLFVTASDSDVDFMR